MSDEQDKTEVNPTPEETPEVVAEPTPDPGPPSPRIRPALVLVGAYLIALGTTLIKANTTMQNAIGLAIAPAVLTLALTVWWLLSRSISLKERAGGLLLFVVVNAWIALNQLPNGPYLLEVSLPILAVGIVVLLAGTTARPWAQRRSMLLVWMAVATVIFTALRVDDVTSSTAPMLSWRWTHDANDWVSQDGAQSDGTATLPTEITEDDWASFRGPARNGHAPGVRFSTDWDDNPPEELWRIPVGIGWSGFTVVGEYAFTQEQRLAEEVVVCYEAETGKQIWVNSVDARFDDSTGSGPRSTPTYHEGALYVQGATGILQRLDPATGKTIWSNHIGDDADARLPVWGFSSSPLIVGDNVLVFAGGTDGKAMLAYHRETGEQVYATGDGTHTYSSPHFAMIEDVPQVLMMTDIGLQSFVPETGDMLWEHKWKASTNPRCVQPLVTDRNMVILLTAGGQGARLIDIVERGDEWTVNEQWTTRKLKPYFNDVVYSEGYIYGFDGKRFMCVDAAMGKIRWKGDRYGGQVLFFPDMDTLLILSEKGELILMDAIAEEAVVLGRMKALDGKTWNHPVVAQGKLFVRNAAEAVCYRLNILPDEEPEEEGGDEEH